MKKISKPADNKPASKKAAAKESSTKPKRKAQSRAELAALVERFTIIADRLDQAFNRLARVQMRQPHTSEDAEHDDDIEVGQREE
jgi:hypothetical protein